MAWDDVNENKRERVNVIDISELKTLMSEKDKREAWVKKDGELLDVPTLVSNYWIHVGTGLGVSLLMVRVG